MGPLGEGAGKIRPVEALDALRDGVVIYRVARGIEAATAPRNQELQGAWMVGVTTPGVIEGARWVLRAAPDAAATQASFQFVASEPSDGSRAIPTDGPLAWSIGLPGPTPIPAGGSAIAHLTLEAPKGTPAGIYSGAVLVSLTNGQQLRVPVVASVPLHDPKTLAGNAPGPRARFASQQDVLAKGDTVWPSLVGAAQGAAADWLIYPVELAKDLERVRFEVYDARTDDDDETYDLYLYDTHFDLVASTHPFLIDGVTDKTRNDARPPSTASDPQVLELEDPPGRRYYLVVSRAKVGQTDPIRGDFGAFVLTVDEVGSR